MNFSSLILEALNKNGSVGLPGFGSFYLKNSNAAVDRESGSILPPGKEVAFRTENEIPKEEFSSLVASQNNISVFEAEMEIKKLTNYWNLTLQKEGQIAIENIGTFTQDDSNIHFTGKRVENLSPDFYGLEEINLTEIKNAATASDSESKKASYALPKTLYWLLPLLLVIAGISYFAVTQPEILFGKKSFDNAPSKKVVPVIKKDSLRKDSTTINPVLDSIKADSATKALKASTAPKKKWSSKNYSKTQWKKSKKRRNH